MRTGARLNADIAGGDLVLGPDGIEFDNGLVTAVLCSLLADARARPEDVEADPNLVGRRGWWNDTDSDRFGSRLWKLSRAKQLDTTLIDAEVLARESLDWLVRDGIASAVTVEAEWNGEGCLELAISLTRGTERRWSYLWADQLEGRYDVEGLGIVLVGTA